MCWGICRAQQDKNRKFRVQHPGLTESVPLCRAGTTAELGLMAMACKDDLVLHGLKNHNPPPKHISGCNTAESSSHTKQHIDARDRKKGGYEDNSTVIFISLISSYNSKHSQSSFVQYITTCNFFLFKPKKCSRIHSQRCQNKLHLIH